jgi:hypothetical protein
MKVLGASIVRIKGDDENVIDHLSMNREVVDLDHLRLVFARFVRIHYRKYFTKTISVGFRFVTLTPPDKPIGGENGGFNSENTKKDSITQDGSGGVQSDHAPVSDFDADDYFPPALIQQVRLREYDGADL